MDVSVIVPIGDPNTDGMHTGSAVIIATLPQGRASWSAMSKGDPGEPPDLRNINVTELEYTDPNPLVWDFDLAEPATPTSPPKWDLNVQVRSGPTSPPAPVKFADLTDVHGAPGEGFMPAWSTNADGSGGDGLVYTPVGHGIGGQFWPSDPLGNTSGANGQLRTLASVLVPVLPRAWRPRPMAGCILSGTVNTRPHLIARVGDAVNGAIVGRGFTVPGVAVQSPHFHHGVPPGSEVDHGVIPGGVGPTLVHLRAEEQASTVDNFTTSGTTTWFFVEAQYV
ncbi:MAG: hypothetical protein U5N53_28210 [Mycobacterium sp.]|nr:hypothetical protein [Mycobacterium sp.]